MSEICPPEKTLFVTTDPELLRAAGKENGIVVGDCNRNEPLETAKTFLQCAKIVFLHRPKVIISTGAAPGLLCLALGKFIGAKRIWIDSFANVEQLSLSGQMAKYVADIWLTQWEHLSRPEGPRYIGELL
ncbi:UDP-N-acetylglucosamine transferase subunit ALG14 [Rhizobiaceae bacterium BDR2-2]|uniref:UDP-N-acetylglucosamine transferase subunit ALG14 n=1 Tax=Ectorhizobium quercum TaxID=2965071 RepID=A0AAE3N1W9_9HYPH|nr:glucuronosyltransferase [Ectorhizobium quercum]MCX8998431.1 UDP-N-acetylglucosamine transferase subunit ALG14 [Ectorhizobium quercum]